MKPKVFIDGSEGTTGLQIFDRLASRDDIELLTIDDAARKDVTARKALINAADVVFLCLPDDAARESVTLIENDTTRVIDASTAHRTNPDWTYGFPELSKAQREKIKSARFVANPGCHATGFIGIVNPLIALGIMSPDTMLTCFSLTGYTGGGKKMIHEYETAKTHAMNSPRLYGMDLTHKHLPEMMYVTGLSSAPVFCPIVCDYPCGISLTIQLHSEQIGGRAAENIRRSLSDYYSGEQFVTVAPMLGSGMLESNWGEGTNMMELTVSGHDNQTIVTARFDNLGKGASGAAVQNMDIMLGL